MGRHTLDMEITFVVVEAWYRPYSTKSDFARTYASEVAAAASLGYISTAEEFIQDYLTPDTTRSDYGVMWRITFRGASLINKTPTHAGTSHDPKEKPPHPNNTRAE